MILGRILRGVLDRANTQRLTDYDGTSDKHDNSFLA
jgi:hypothetical protein